MATKYTPEVPVGTQAWVQGEASDGRPTAVDEWALFTRDCYAPTTLILHP